MYIHSHLKRPSFRCGDKAKLHKKSALDVSKNRYYTTSQLARRWGVSVMTIIRLIEQGELNGLKIRGSYRISLRSIKHYEEKVAF